VGDWAAISAAATRSFGVVTLAELHADGFGRSAITRAVAAGRLHRLAPGVYAVGHRALGADGRRLAAVLACGPLAVLDAASAAAQWGLADHPLARVDVAVPSAAGRTAPAGVRLHRRPGLRTDECGRLGAVPVTSLPRTLLDLAAVARPGALAAAVDRAEELRVLDAGAVETALARHAGRRGAPALRAALTAHTERGLTLTRSELERRFLALCADHGLPRPRANVPLAGLEVDFLFPGGLVVEADGRRHHEGRLAFERDRERDATLLVAGHRVLRLTHRRIVREPAAAAALVRRLLG